MPIIFHNQSNFTSGEIGPLLSARADFKGFEAGAAKLRNVLVIPQGGVKRRFGTQFIDEYTGIKEKVTSKDDLKFVVLEFNVSPRYLLVFTPQLITIYLIDDANVTTKIFTLLTLYNKSEIKDLNFTQDTNVLVIMHENHQPALLRRIKSTLVNGVDIGWNADTNTPPLASGVGTADEAYFVNTAGATVLDGHTDWLVDEWAFFRISLNMWEKLQPLPPNAPWELVNANFKYFPTFDFKGGYDDVSFRPDKLGGDGARIDIVIITTPGYRFSPNLVGGIFTGNGGTMRITGVIAKPNSPPDPPNPPDTAITGDIIQPFTGDGKLSPDIKDIDGKTVLITEPAFGSSRGWPKTGAFFQDRLWFGGSKSLPHAVFASQINDFFDFDDTAGVATDAIFILIGSRKSNIIQQIVASQSLVVFASDGEFSTQLILESGITPQNISMLPQSKVGAANVEPAVIDNQIIFVNRGGRIISNMVYNATSGAYRANPISFISSQLIDNPTSSSVFKGHTADDSTYLFLVNEGTPGTEIEGSIAAFQTLRSQEIAAWSLLTTNGKFLQTTSASDITFFFTERNGKFLIEKLDFGLFLDGAIVQTYSPPTNIIQNLDYLDNHLVRVFGDGIILDGPENGLWRVVGNVISLPPKKLVTDVIVGLDFKTLIETMPINVDTPLGPTLYLPKTIIRVFIDFFESLGIEVDGFPLPNLTFSIDNFVSKPPVPRSGVEELKINTGYTKDRQIVKITQSLPFPMTIRAIGLEVSI